MRFTVVWKVSAEQRLAEIWTEAMNPAAIAAASDEIDRLLARNPEARGEARSGAVRVLVERPLVVDFEVIAEDLIVVVLRVHVMAARP